MMTLAPIRSAQHASTYFERSDHPDYYLRDDVCPSYWAGKGAEILGISGEVVDSDRFKRYLLGDIAGSTIGTNRDGKYQHKPGFDLQFSPAKSVSVMALVAGDQRIIEAHDKAVNEAISFLEEKAAYTRVHTRELSGKDSTEHVLTGNLLCAAFRHDTSRAQDPQLHSHAVVMNATLRDDGEWRSIESRHFYSLQKEAGLHYRQSLAASLIELGYSIDRAADANFEISGIPHDLLDTFSQRRDVINKELAKQGYSREDAPACLKEKVAHASREKKVHVDPEYLREQWRDTVKEHQLDVDEIVKESVRQSQDKKIKEKNNINSYETLQKIMNNVIDSLSERDSVFSKDVLINEINKLAVGFGVSNSQVENAVEYAEKEGMLIGERKTKIYSPQSQCWKEVYAYTTPDNIRVEENMINTMFSGKGKENTEFTKYEIKNILEVADKDSVDKGFSGWTAGQKTVTRSLLASDDQFSALQGYAGTAKTSTVLRTLAQEFELRGYQVVGMAPSASACQSLQQGADIENVVTVASHLLSRDSSFSKGKSLWLVDEASLLSTKDTCRLLTKANKQNARVILVGDVKQLGSVEAGAAFRQMQENGIPTYELDQIVRQDNERTLDAVYSAIEGDAQRVLDILSNGGGKVIEESEDAMSRHQRIADDYLSLTKKERRKTLLIDPSREGRDNLTQHLRTALRKTGELEESELKIDRLDKIDLTKSAAKDVLNYEEGDIVRFGRDYKSKKVHKHEYWTVSEIDSGKNTITLLSIDGQRVIWNPNAWGTKMQAFRRIEGGLSEGDRVVWTMNDRKQGLLNGTKGIVKAIDNESGVADVLFANEKQIRISLDQISQQHWNHDYVTTAHAAQGMTADRVYFHAESFRRNLANQKAFYVAISRAKQEAVIYTDNQEQLVAQIKECSGEKQVAKEKVESYEHEID